jgi:hypothetical protein
MDQEYENTRDRIQEITDAPISRRATVGSSGLAILSLLAGSAFGREGIDWEAVRKSQEKSRQEATEAERRAQEEAYQRMLQRKDPAQRAFFEQMRNTSSPEEQAKIMQDWHIQQSLAKFKMDLAVSEEEWTVVQPRLAAVLRLMQAPYGAGGTGAAVLVAQKTIELQELLANKEAKPEDIRAGLTALRTVKEQARQELAQAQRSLRQVMTVRQEATLVLNGLLN